jgi:hypothetical protein
MTMGSQRNILPDTAERVPAHTAREINRRIQRRTAISLAYFAEHPDEISHRLDELDREWDIERTLEANAATIGLAGVLLGAFVNRRFLALPGLVTAFLLQHALQGWCPPVPVFRRLGVRTMREIDRERYALKYLRGDFESTPADAPPRERARRALAACQV